MAKDNMQLLRRFIEDEELALKEGRTGELWEKERARMGPLLKRAWRDLSMKECQRLYVHLMRRTRRLPEVGEFDFLNLSSAYIELDPDWDRIGLTFRFGRSPRGLLTTGFVEQPKEFFARHKLLERFRGFPDAKRLRGRANRFKKDAERYGKVALDALRHCGYSETNDADEVPDSVTYWGLILLVAFDPVARLDCWDELASLPAFSSDEAHRNGLEETVRAVEDAG